MDKFAYLIVTGSPDYTEFGIDLLAINVTTEFRGVKLIPPGPHFIYCSAKEDSFGIPSSSRSGFMKYFKAGEVIVKEWNEQTEELQDRTKGDLELEIERIKENLKDLDRFLAIYEFENLEKWKGLSCLISEDGIARLSPDCGKIRSAAEFHSCPDSERPRGKPDAPIRNIRIKSAADEAMYLPNLQVIEGTQPKYSKIPERITKATAPADVTFNNIDTINLIDKLLNEITNENDLLEELQFSFILYLCGLSVDSLAHWRQIVSLFCNSDSAIEKYRNFYNQFVHVIKFQLPEIPIEFVEQSPSNSIYNDVKNLLKNLLLANLSDVSKLLQEHLRETINWTFDDLLEEDPDDLPQIVEVS